MIEKFQEAQRAIAYVCGGLRKHLDGAHMEVLWYPKENMDPIRSVVEEAQLAATLEQYCRHLTAAIAVYEPDCAAIPLGAIQCRRDHHHERACVCVVVCSRENPPSEEQKRVALLELHKRIHDHRHQKEEKPLRRHHR